MKNIGFMKNIALTIVLALVLAACSSGSTVADIPFNVTGTYFGEYENSTNMRDGTFTLNIAEDQAGNINGTIIYDKDPLDAFACEINSVVSGDTSGFSVRIVADVNAGENATGTITFQLTQSNSGNNLNGSYVSTGIDVCSNGSGSGTVTMTR